MVNILSGMRFPGNLNADLRKMATSLIPFPRVKFMIVKNSPYRSRNNSDRSSIYNNLTTSDIMENLFDQRNQSYARPFDHPILNLYMILRGDFNGIGVNDNITRLYNYYNKGFDQWSGTFSMAFVKVPPLNTKKSGTCILNSRSICERF